jgi:AcrR family transcriptional regulator
VNTRRLIISAFRELIARQSVGSISVNMIISAAEISKPTFYRNFYSKYELVNVVFEEILSPLQRATEGAQWRDVLEDALASLEKNSAIIKNGFRTPEEEILRDICMRQILEPYVLDMLKGRGVDVRDQNVSFAIRAMVLVHVAAFVGWSCDSGRKSREIVADQLCASLPALLINAIV